MAFQARSSIIIVMAAMAFTVVVAAAAPEGNCGGVVGCGADDPNRCIDVDGTKNMTALMLAYANNLTSAVLTHQNVSLHFPALKAFATMDLIYLMNYSLWVKTGLNTCSQEQGNSNLLGSGILGRVAFFPDDVTYYQSIFPNLDPLVPNPALRNYMNFYLQSGGTCATQIASMMVCLCSYGVLAQGISYYIQSGQIIPPPTQDELVYLKNFVSYNLPDPSQATVMGTACRYADEYFSYSGTTPDINVLNAALANEQALWSAAPGQGRKCKPK